MFNPFRNPNEEMRQQQREEANLSLSANTLANPAQAYDEQRAAERREVLVQLTQWQQDRSSVMQKLFLKLCSMSIDDETKMLTEVKWDSPVVSMWGAKKLIDFIEPLDHNVMLANWDTANLIKTMRDAIAHPLRRFIFQNHNLLDLKIEQAEYVFWLIVNTIEPNYWRGWNDGERRKDREIIKVNELRNPYLQKEKKGIFGTVS